jgi:uncharacterized protein YprB with RNaseH-like and TPR domain
MADFSKALRDLQDRRHPPLEPPGKRWESQLSQYVLGGISPRSMLPPGEVRANALGSHYLIHRAYPHGHFHGKVRLNRLSSSDLQCLLTLMREKSTVPECGGIVFLDTETTGIQGGTGICPFLVGLGYLVEGEFHLVQFFIRDFDEEPSMLFDLAAFLRRFQMVITYNGAAFDIPLLETRFTLARMENPFHGMPHFDLLFTARKLWRNGHGSCRLAALERELVSFMRGPDIPGAMIPRAYFDYLQRRPNTLRSVFTHNGDDVLSLAALTVAACDRVTLPPAALDEPLDLYSLARVFEKTENWRGSMRFYEMALEGVVSGPARQKILESLAVIYRRAGENERSIEVCIELIESPEFSMTGYEGAAIYYERFARNYEAALRVLQEGVGRADTKRSRSQLQARWDRLQQKIIRF